MKKLVTELSKINSDENIEEHELVEQIKSCIQDCGYTLTEVNEDKPWGSYLKFDNKDTDKFLSEFFPGQIVDDNILASKGMGLNAKLLIVSPGQGLSWQYHNRRSEVWSYLTAGGYRRSMTDKQGELRTTHRGDVVQFAAGERHRLVGREDGYTIVAEIWQNTDLDNLSDEEDIVRLIDDYSRVSKKAMLKNWIDSLPKPTEIINKDLFK